MDEIPPAELSDLWKKIVDNIKLYDNENDLVAEIERLKKESDENIEKFRDLFINLTEYVCSVTDSMTVQFYKKDIIDAIKKNPKNITDAFILQGYKGEGLYRKQLVERKEDFFLNHSFEDVTEGKSSMINKLFQFKSFWCKLSEPVKDIIKFYLLTLCSYSDVRYVNFNKYLELKKNNEHLRKVFDKYNDTF